MIRSGRESFKNHKSRSGWLQRRKLALELGADYAFDPSDPEFVNKVKAVTKGKGVNACVEVTGVSAAMNQALECASWMDRISLLGCTRVSNSSADYWNGKSGLY